MKRGVTFAVLAVLVLLLVTLILVSKSTTTGMIIKQNHLVYENTIFASFILLLGLIISLGFFLRNQK
jgi:hypothetical protein